MKKNNFLVKAEKDDAFHKKKTFMRKILKNKIRVLARTHQCRLYAMKRIPVRLETL